MPGFLDDSGARYLGAVVVVAAADGIAAVADVVAVAAVAVAVVVFGVQLFAAVCVYVVVALVHIAVAAVVFGVGVAVVVLRIFFGGCTVDSVAAVADVDAPAVGVLPGQLQTSPGRSHSVTKETKI